MTAYEITVSSKYDTIINADDTDQAADFAMDEYTDIADEAFYDIKLESIKEVL